MLDDAGRGAVKIRIRITLCDLDWLILVVINIILWNFYQSFRHQIPSMQISAQVTPKCRISLCCTTVTAAVRCNSEKLLEFFQAVGKACHVVQEAAVDPLFQPAPHSRHKNGDEPIIFLLVAIEIQLYHPLVSERLSLS